MKRELHIKDFINKIADINDNFNDEKFNNIKNKKIFMGKKSVSHLNKKSKEEIKNNFIKKLEEKKQQTVKSYENIEEKYKNRKTKIN